VYELNQEHHSADDARMEALEAKLDAILAHLTSGTSYSLSGSNRASNVQESTIDPGLGQHLHADGSSGAYEDRRRFGDNGAEILNLGERQH
jgi:hypothetical protein